MDENKLSITQIKDKNIKQYVISYNKKDIIYLINKEESENYICDFGIEEFNKQHRLNLSIMNNYNNGFIKFINFWETYFKNSDLCKNYNLLTSIKNRDKFDPIIVIHLNYKKNKIITNINNITWYELEKLKKFNIYGYIVINCLWINEFEKTFGISLDWKDVYYLK